MVGASITPSTCDSLFDGGLVLSFMLGNAFLDVTTDGLGSEKELGLILRLGTDTGLGLEGFEQGC